MSIIDFASAYHNHRNPELSTCGYKTWILIFIPIESISGYPRVWLNSLELLFCSSSVKDLSSLKFIQCIFVQWNCVIPTNQDPPLLYSTSHTGTSTLPQNTMYFCLLYIYTHICLYDVNFHVVAPHQTDGVQFRRRIWGRGGVLVALLTPIVIHTQGPVV